MLKAGTETGSLINHVMSQSTGIRDHANIKPGDGATMLGWTDRHAATVVKVTRTQVHVRRDKATRTDTNGQSEVQSWTFEPDPNAPVLIYRRRKDGSLKGAYGQLVVGHRDEYYDYSF